MDIIPIILSFLLLLLGLTLIKYSRKIANATNFSFIPGIDVPAFIEKYILRRKPKHPFEEPGMRVHIWFIRFFGIWCILLAAFIVYVIIFD